MVNKGKAFLIPHPMNPHITLLDAYFQSILSFRLVTGGWSSTYSMCRSEYLTLGGILRLVFLWNLESGRERSLYKSTLDYDDLVVAIAAMPLHSHPGKVWNYGYDFDVLSLFLTRESGMSLDALFQDKVLGPLGMHDSAFYCCEADLGRLVTEHKWDPMSENLQIRDRPETTEKAGRADRRLMSDNGMFGGLLSSPRDFARFAQMLANGGELDGVRILGRKTVELMRTNHIGDRCIDVYGPNYGFGLGVFVRKSIESTFIPGSAGTYGWAGAAGTWFFVDPKEELFGLFFTQVFGFPHPTALQFEKMTYEALC